MIALIQRVASAHVEVDGSRPRAVRGHREDIVSRVKLAHTAVETGILRADLQVHRVNDGPAKFWLRAGPDAPALNEVST